MPAFEFPILQPDDLSYPVLWMNNSLTNLEHQDGACLIATLIAIPIAVVRAVAATAAFLTWTGNAHCQLALIQAVAVEHADRFLRVDLAGQLGAQLGDRGLEPVDAGRALGELVGGGAELLGGRGELGVQPLYRGAGASTFGSVSFDIRLPASVRRVE